MKQLTKTAVLRGLLGIPLGIALGHVISIFSSLNWAGGFFSPCVPAFVESMGSEIAAVALQTALCGVMGAVFGAASVVWNREDWCIARQSVVYFLAAALAMLPIAWVTHWMEHSAAGIALYAAIFAAVFAAVWLSQYLLLRRRIREINQKMK